MEGGGLEMFHTTNTHTYTETTVWCDVNPPGSWRRRRRRGGWRKRRRNHVNTERESCRARRRGEEGEETLTKFVFINRHKYLFVVAVIDIFRSSLIRALFFFLI